MFRARDRALRRMRPLRLSRMLEAVIPAALTDWIATRRAERTLQAQILRLEDLSGHLLEDVGIMKLGPSDYIVFADDLELVPPLREAKATMLAAPPEFAPLLGKTAAAPA